MSLEEKRLKREIARRQKKKELSREKAMGVVEPASSEGSEQSQSADPNQEPNKRPEFRSAFKDPQGPKKFNQGNRRPEGSVPRTGTRGS
jgi:hypothetical protein